MQNTHWVLSDLKEPHSSLPLFSASNLWTRTSPASLSHLIVSVVPCWPRYPLTQVLVLPCHPVLGGQIGHLKKQNKKTEQTPLYVPASALSRTGRVLPPPRIAESLSVWLQHTLHHLLLLMMSCEGTVSAVTQLEQPEWDQVLFKIKWSDQCDYSLQLCCHPGLHTPVHVRCMLKDSQYSIIVAQLNDILICWLESSSIHHG